MNAPLSQNNAATTLTGAEWLAYLRRQRLLAQLLRQALADKVVHQAALVAGLTVSDAELQQAANRFRQRHGLASIEETRRWLAQHHLTAADWQDGLERDLLQERFLDHLCRTEGAVYFAAHADRYARARLRLIVSPSEGECREIAAQVTDDGRDFADLARQHSRHASRSTGGDLGVVLRCQLPVTMADVVFGAAPDSLVGPRAGEDGFCLFQVVERLPAELDERTTAIVRQHLFEDWLRQRLAGVRFDSSWLRSVNELL